MTSYNYTNSDGFVSTSTATVKIDVFSNKPVVNDDTFTIRPNQVMSVAAPGLLANDSDPDGDTLSVVALDVNGLQGSMTPFADGHFSFTPTTGFTGTASFKYAISDGFGGTATAKAVIDVLPIPTRTLSIGNAPERQSGLGGQWTAAWTNTDIVTSIVHKADYASAAETWSATRLNGVSPQTLAGGNIYAGDLGVSGQSEATSPVRQEIDGKEAPRFNLAEGATGLTVYRSRLLTQDDGGDFIESGRLRLLDADAHLVKAMSFHAARATGTQRLL